MASLPEPPLIARSAAELAALVRSGQLAPTDVVRAFLERIAAVDERVGAFQLLRGERALAEAEALARRPDLRALPLAGVPIAVKDNLDVAGEPTRAGSSATSEQAALADHEVVRRVRAAGAIVVGKTRVPELCVWPTTDGPLGAARNPWRLDHTPGGSSGGSAAAVAAGMVPIALGNDGLGSIRIPAACCGVLGLKPGSGVIPSGIGAESWLGMAENGPLAATAEDAALLFEVLAGATGGERGAGGGTGGSAGSGPGAHGSAPAGARQQEPARPLRIALSTRPPTAGIRVDREWARAAEESAQLLAAAGHTVERADPPYPQRLAPFVFAFWMAGAATDARGLDAARLDPRTRRHAALGRLALRAGWADQAHRRAWAEAQAPFFARFDVLLTPTLARPPLELDAWNRRGWLRNVVAAARYAPFPAPWNFAGFPAAAVPAGMHSGGLPLSVQLAAAPGGERLLLRLAAELERARPWRRQAPL